MSFITRLPDQVPGLGSPARNDALFLKQALVLSGTAQQTNVIPASGNFSPALCRGKIRVKLSAPSTSGVSPAVSSLYFVLTDGTNFVDVGRHSSEVMQLGGATPSASIPNYVDRILEFEVDINAVSLSVVSTLTGTNPIVLMDVEISGTAGYSTD